jgi:hypothetical protein
VSHVQEEAHRTMKLVDAVVDPNPLHVLADVAQKEEGLQATSRNPNLGGLLKWRAATAEFLAFREDVVDITAELEQQCGKKSWRSFQSGITPSFPVSVDWAGEMVALLMQRATFATIIALLQKHDVCKGSSCHVCACCVVVMVKFVLSLVSFRDLRLLLPFKSVWLWKQLELGCALFMKPLKLKLRLLILSNCSSKAASSK